MNPQKETTRQHYEQGLNALSEYISAHLSEDISLELLARTSGFSPFHLHRIVKAFLGETPGALVTRLRLESAARLLRHTAMPIADIAYQVGYDVPASLSKAFRQYYGISPLEYRQNKQFHIMKPSQADLSLNIKKPKILDIPDKQAAYIRLSGAYQDNDYPAAWGKLWQYVKENKLFSAGIEHLCIYHDDPKVTPKDRLRAEVCLVLPKQAAAQGEIGVKKIQGGKYAVFLYTGSYEHLGAVYDTIYSEWLPTGGYRLRDSYCYEKYLNHPGRTAPEKRKTEIYLPIEE